MFVQSKATTFAKQRNGIAIKQRRGEKETLVQWENGDQRWVATADLSGAIRLMGDVSEYDHEQ